LQLRQMAFDLLLVPNTSCEIERLFSSAKELITPNRNSLSEETIEIERVFCKRLSRFASYYGIGGLMTSQRVYLWGAPTPPSHQHPIRTTCGTLLYRFRFDDLANIGYIKVYRQVPRSHSRCFTVGLPSLPRPG